MVIKNYSSAYRPIFDYIVNFFEVIGQKREKIHIFFHHVNKDTDSDFDKKY